MKVKTRNKNFITILIVCILAIVLSGLSVSIFGSVKKPEDDRLVYGVTGIGSGSSLLKRTDDSISLSYSIVDGVVESDFDDVYPYSHMKKVVDDFGNVFIKIPKFYSKFSKNKDGSLKLQISKDRLDGFSTLFVDGTGSELDYVLIGAYENSGDSSRLYSKPGVVVSTGLTIDEVRTACRSNGENYQQLDYLTLMIVNQLFTVEFATMDSQSVFNGYTASYSSHAIPGSTDELTSSSGFIDTGAFKYRGIENIYGNVWKFIDGILFSNQYIFISTDPDSYTSQLSENPMNTPGYDYFRSVNRDLSEGWFGKLNIFEESASLVFPSYVNKKDISFGDYGKDINGTTKLGGSLLFYGGPFGFTNRAGLWCFFTEQGPDYTNVYYGSRLVYKPITRFSNVG